MSMFLSINETLTLLIVQNSLHVAHEELVYTLYSGLLLCTARMYSSFFGLICLLATCAEMFIIQGVPIKKQSLRKN